MHLQIGNIFSERKKSKRPQNLTLVFHFNRNITIYHMINPVIIAI